MIVLIDVGNSNIVIGLSDSFKIQKTFRIKTILNKTEDEYYLIIKDFLNDQVVDDVIISSVVPVITSAFKKLFVKHYDIESIVIGPGVKTGMKVLADDPKSVGADLVCDCVGASLKYDECLIIDLGTATKYMYLKNHCLCGVSIAPGVATSMKAMIESAALLPNMELQTPKNVLNNNTISCMQSGVIYGFASQVDGMIERIKKEEKKEEINIIATGGLSKLIIPLCFNNILLDEFLVLEGLLYIYNKNKKEV